MSHDGKFILRSALIHDSANQGLRYHVNKEWPFVMDYSVTSVASVVSLMESDLEADSTSDGYLSW